MRRDMIIKFVAYVIAVVLMIVFTKIVSDNIFERIEMYVVFILCFVAQNNAFRS